jgi:hypothetical protein
MKHLVNWVVLLAVIAMSETVHAQEWVTPAQVNGTTLSCRSNGGANQTTGQSISMQVNEANIEFDVIPEK